MMNSRVMSIHIFIGVLLCIGLASSAYDAESCEPGPDDNLCDYNSMVDLRPTESGDEVSCGEILTQESTSDRPFVSYPGANQDKSYTLVMVDPDAPFLHSFLHWMVTNIKGSDLRAGRLQGADEKVAYVGPSPPRGMHRYQFYFLKQPSSSIDVVAPSRRGRFNVKKFIRSHNLCLIAAFQYQVQALY